MRVRFSIFKFLALGMAVAGGTALAQAKPGPANAAAVKPQGNILPVTFAGWQQSAMSVSRDPEGADPPNAAVLKEFGFVDQQHASFIRDGRRLEVDALRFADASGAYGAYTLYLQPDAIKEDVGDEAASVTGGILFRRGNLVLEAKFEALTAMSASELRELAAALPLPAGPQATLPTLPSYLPKPGLAPNSVRYVVGPAGFEQLGEPIAPDVVNFSREPEVVKAHYNREGAVADLLLIYYPTPQIAGDRMRAFQNALGTQPGIVLRRTGPVVVMASDAAGGSDARALAGAVHYDANVTWSEPTYSGPRDNIGNLIIAILVLIGILLLLALVAGIAFGGIRVAMKRLFPNRVFDRSRDVEIIRLKLEE